MLIMVIERVLAAFLALTDEPLNKLRIEIENCEKDISHSMGIVDHQCTCNLPL